MSHEERTLGGVNVMGHQNFTCFNSHYLERNAEICKLVLNGKMLNDVGKKFNISTSTVRLVVFKFCKVANPIEYSLCDKSLILLRERSGSFLPRISELAAKYKEI